MVYVLSFFYVFVLVGFRGVPNLLEIVSEVGHTGLRQAALKGFEVIDSSPFACVAESFSVYFRCRPKGFLLQQVFSSSALAHSIV
jgi:hypothetical protein